jgi:acyl carrier protein
MSREDICRFINNVFATMTDVETIQEDDDLIEDLGISSMDTLTMISYLEEEFRITITERMLRKVATVGDLIDLVQSAME